MKYFEKMTAKFFAIILICVSILFVTVYAEDETAIQTEGEMTTQTADQSTDLISIPVTVKWDDDNDQNKMRPAEVKVQLLANGNAVANQKATITATNNWTYTFENLAKVDDKGQLITYTVTEDKLSDSNMPEYKTTIVPKDGGFEITNTQNFYKPVTADNVFTKTEFYHENALGIAGNFHLVGFNSVSNPADTNGNILTRTMNYQGEFGTRYKKEVSYIQSLVINQDGFRSARNADESILVVGSNVRVGIKDNGAHWALNGQKADQPDRSKNLNNLWQDTQSAKFIDIADVESNMKSINKQLSQYENTIDEESAVSYQRNPNYQEKSNMYIDISNQNSVNVYNLDADDLVSKQITDININGFSQDQVSTFIINVDLNGKSTFTIPRSIFRYTNDYTAPTGEVTEWQNANVLWNFYDSSNDNYAYTGTINNSGAVTGHILAPYADVEMEHNLNGTIIANNITIKGGETHRTDFTGTTIIPETSETPETPDEEKTSIQVTKKWEDNDNQDGIRPKSIEVKLFANGGTKAIDTATITADENGEWQHTFEGLPKYENGEEITYTVTEEKVEDYETSINGFTITNTHVPNVVSIPVEKIWKDEEDKDRIRPESVTVKLSGGGEEQTLELNETNGWKGTFENLPENKDGKKIDYAVQEINVKEGYTSKIEEKNNGFIIINTHKPGFTSIPVEKIWKDNNNQDGIRPKSIEVKLFANGGTEAIDTATITADENGEWQHTFEGLPKYENGEKIDYTVTEEPVSGYVTKVEPNSENGGFTITNSHEPETTSVKVNKIWQDNNDPDGKRKSITVQLFANDGTETIDTATITADENGEWQHTFNDLPKYENGKKINYTVTEEKVEGYQPVILSSVSNLIEDNETIINIINIRTTEVQVRKVWNDNNNQDGSRPDSIKVQLFANNTKIDEKELSDQNNWIDTFKDLHKYDENGEKIDYTVTEVPVSGYDIKVEPNEEKDEFTITNTPINLTVNKVDSKNNTVMLSNAEFKLYGWSKDENKYVEMSQYTTNENGQINISKLNYNTAYYLEEIKAPDGYELPSGEDAKHYFYINNNDKGTYPDVKPDGFKGQKLEAEIVDNVMNLTLTLENKQVANLEIIKTLNTYNISAGDAMFAFQVDVTDEGKLIYSQVLSMNFTEAGTKSLTIENLPVGAEVTVTEVYSGASYEAVDSQTKTTTIQPTDTQVSFINDYTDNGKYGSGILNHIEKTDSGWSFSQQKESESIFKYLSNVVENIEDNQGGE